MKELKPNYISELLSLSSASQENLERCTQPDTFTTSVGQVFRQGKLCYLARNSCLEVIYSEDGSRKASCNFENNYSSVITSVIYRESSIGRGSQIVLGLHRKDAAGSTGLVCVFDTEIGKVVKSILIPMPVSSIAEIADLNSIGSNAGLISDLLCDYHGILAVGTVGGHLYLLDLKDDVPVEETVEPSNIVVVKSRDDLSFFKDQKKYSAKKHCCIYLTDAVCSSRAFQYVDPNATPLRVFKKDDVSVSCLLHINQCGLLICGFSFGCFQVWDLNSLDLIYSNPPEVGLGGISHLLFQEPENDPRHCCYIWVGRGPLPSEPSSDNPTTVSLYQLVFDMEKYVLGIGTVYQELEGVCLRFEHQLTSDVFHLADSMSVGGRILCAHVLERDSKRSGIERIDPDGQHMDTTLAYFVWEAPEHDTEVMPTSCHMGIFDINRWYHMQMPFSVRDAIYGSKDVACPFFAFYSLTDVIDTVAPDGIVDVYINPDEIQMYSSSITPKPEQYFWPSSLAFDCLCLSERSLVRAEMLGIQRQILADIVRKETNSFSEAHALFNMCWAAGLIPNTFDISRPQDKQLHFEALLSVVLEHNAVLFIQSCVRRWTAGDITFPGCSLRLVLNWAWKRVISTKEQLDNLHGCLFDGYSYHLDTQYLKTLEQCSLQVHHLVGVLLTLQTCPVPITEEGNSDFKIKLKVAKYIQQYVDALLLLIDYGMLPEQQQTKKGNFESCSNRTQCTIYPFTTVRDYYNSRRDEINGLDSEAALHIDTMSMVVKKYVEDFGMNSDLDWDGTYPPPAVNVVSRLFLMDLGEEEAKRYFYYWALDMDECLGKVGDETLAPKAVHKFNIPMKEKELIQALWFIDHKLFAAGMKKLTNANLPSGVLKDVVITLFNAGESAYALQLLLGTKIDYSDNSSVSVFTDILLQNGLLNEAYRIQGKLSGKGEDTSLFKDFLAKCYEYKMMSKLFQLPLLEVEEQLLLDFLNSRKDRRAMDLLLTYYLQRGLHIEVFKLQKKLGKMPMVSMDLIEHNNVITQQAIAESYMKLLPRVQQKLMSDASLQSLLIAKKREQVQPLKPLSAVTRMLAKTKSQSRSGILHATLCSIEANSGLSDDNEEIATFKPFVGVPITPKSSGQSRVRSGSVVIPKQEKLESPTKGKYERPRKSTPQTDIPIKRRKHLYSGADALQLLKTPPVIKRPQVHQVLSESVFTPTSILKSRTTSRTGDDTKTTGKEALDKSLMDRSVFSSTDISSIDMTDTTRRRIRFAVLNSPDSDLSTSHDASIDLLRSNDPSKPDVTLSPVESPTLIKEKTAETREEMNSDSVEATASVLATENESKEHNSVEDTDKVPFEYVISHDVMESPNKDTNVKKNLTEEFTEVESDMLSQQTSELLSKDPKALDSGLDLCLEDEDDGEVAAREMSSGNTTNLASDATTETTVVEAQISHTNVVEQSKVELSLNNDESVVQNVEFLKHERLDLPGENPVVQSDVLSSAMVYDTLDNTLGSKESGLCSSEGIITYDADMKENGSRDTLDVTPEAIELTHPDTTRNVMTITEEDIREVQTTTEEIIVIEEQGGLSNINKQDHDKELSSQLQGDDTGTPPQTQVLDTSTKLLNAEDKDSGSPDQLALGSVLNHSAMVDERHEMERVLDSRSQEGNYQDHEPSSQVLGSDTQEPSHRSADVKECDTEIREPSDLPGVLPPSVEKISISEDNTCRTGVEDLRSSDNGTETSESFAREPLVFDLEDTSAKSAAVQEIVAPALVLRITPTNTKSSPEKDKEKELRKSSRRSPSRKSRSSPPKKVQTLETPSENYASTSPQSPSSKLKRRSSFKTSFKVDPDDLFSPPLTRSASRRLSGTPNALSSTRSSLPTYQVDSPLSFVVTNTDDSTPTGSKKKTRRSLDITPTHRMRLRSHIRSRGTPRILEK